MTNRLFIAVEMDTEVQGAVAKLVQEFEKWDFVCKYVEAQKAHITLRFLGEVSNQDLEKVKEGCSKAVEGLKQFNLKMEGLGAFPNLDHIKIIWVGATKGSENMKELAARINEFVEVGEKDSRKFVPHLTFGRVRSNKNREKMIQLITGFKTKEFGETLVREIVLKKSELTPEGPVYTDLARFSLEKE